VVATVSTAVLAKESLGQKCVNNRIRYAVTNFVRVTFGYGLTGEDKVLERRGRMLRNKKSG
jgi:hypothetical protein